MTENYILITPLKDEAHNLHQLKETVLSQTVKPRLWVIVDSKSSDGGFLKAKTLFKRYAWVHIIMLEKTFDKGYSHRNFAEAINEGYSYAKHVCREEEVEYTFVGKTDATPVLARNYFEALMTEMKKDASLVITCGVQYFNQGRNRDELSTSWVPSSGINDIRLYRKVFFDESGGYPLSYSPDTVLHVKAICEGWGVKVVRETSFLKGRIGGSKIGVWNGAKLKGKAMHALGYHPLLALLNSSYNFCMFSPHYQGLGMLWGYFSGHINKEERINDKEVLTYFGDKRLKEVLAALGKKIWR